MVAFFLCVNSMRRGHYRGQHNNLYCGRLRSDAGICVPFALLQECDDAVDRHLHAALELVVDFATVHEDVVVLDLPYADQAALRAHFRLPPLAGN